MSLRAASSRASSLRFAVLDQPRSGAQLDLRQGRCRSLPRVHVDAISRAASAWAPSGQRGYHVVVQRSTSFRTKTLRMLPVENAIFDATCEALNGMEGTQLMQEAVIFEAARLGIRWTGRRRWNRPRTRALLV